MRLRLWSDVRSLACACAVLGCALLIQLGTARSAAREALSSDSEDVPVTPTLEADGSAPPAPAAGWPAEPTSVERTVAPDPKAAPSGGDPSSAGTALDPCPDGMVSVDGDYYPVVGHLCRERIEGLVERCGEYARGAAVEGRAEHKHFCVDRFEYPNLEGVRPVVMVSWTEAKAACAAEGKRLCTASEWTLACEGSERLPYPYGYRRDSTACNIDRPHPTPDENALVSSRSVSGEVARLDQRVASGEMARCKSPFGAQDMTGNVDEWVVNERHFGPPPADGSERPFISALKGGYWGPVRNRCRATTTAHNESFRYYQVGFRCCGDSP
jgi:sulfatase modifying factor 1